MENFESSILQINAMKNSFLIFLIALAACNQTSKIKDDTFIVPEAKKPVSQNEGNSDPPLPPPPERAYYLAFNFIIDTTGEVYFFQMRPYRRIDGSDLAWDMPPPFIGLEPKDIVKLPPNNIGDFIKANIFMVDSTERFVSIGAIKDTIISASLARIIACIRDSSAHTNWLFRKVTEEESMVLNYKKTGAYYNPDNIKWDSSKIRFMPKLEGDLKFPPPLATRQK